MSVAGSASDIFVSGSVTASADVTAASAPDATVASSPGDVRPLGVALRLAYKVEIKDSVAKKD